MESVEEYTISQVAKELKCTTREIRRFCYQGLIPNVRHRAAGRRIFTPSQVDWVRTLIHLRDSGMLISDLKNYTALCRRGDSTVSERKAMLETKKRQLWQQLEDIQSNIDFLERKIEIFDKKLAGDGELPEQFF